jgi:hypothetical protein
VTGTSDYGSDDSGDDDDLKLDPATLSHLNEFLSVKKEQQQLFDQLRLTAEGQEDRQQWTPISIDEYKHIFSENWQLSQFWYSTSFAERLARMIEASLPQLASSKPTIAFMCSPTAFVALLSTCTDIANRCNPVLMEYDGRFAALPGRFVNYDLDEPDQVPEDLVRSVDLAVIDPPFLNMKTNIKLCRTLERILRDGNSQEPLNPLCSSGTGRITLLSSAGPGMSEDDLVQIYNSTLEGLFQGRRDRGEGLAASGPSIMKEVPIQVEHDGGRLANNFRCWANWDIPIPKQSFPPVSCLE